MRTSLSIVLALSCWLGGTSVAHADKPTAERMLYCTAFPDAPSEEGAQEKNFAIYSPYGFPPGKLKEAEFFDPHALLAGRDPNLVMVRGEQISFVTTSLPVSQLIIQPTGRGEFIAMVGSDGKPPKKGVCLEVGGPLIQQLVTQFRADPKSVDNPQ